MIDPTRKIVFGLELHLLHLSLLSVPNFNFVPLTDPHAHTQLIQDWVGTIHGALRPRWANEPFLVLNVVANFRADVLRTKKTEVFRHVDVLAILGEKFENEIGTGSS